MPGPYDTTLRDLTKRAPRDWLDLLGIQAESAEPIEVLAADMTLADRPADTFYRVHGEAPGIVHLELQSSYEADFGLKAGIYYLLARRIYRQPMDSYAILLRPEADGPGTAGPLDLEGRDGRTRLWFGYNVVRIWEVPAEQILSGGLATLPLAPLAKGAPERIDEVVRRMAERLERETNRPGALTLWTCTYVLMGLRYTREHAAALLRGVGAMKESVTYQAILEEGREQGIERGREEGGLLEARSILLRIGRKRLGEPESAVADAISAITDRERLEMLTERILDVENWIELLAV